MTTITLSEAADIIAAEIAIATSMTLPQIAGLTNAQISALTKIQVASLTIEQITALIPAQIASLNVKWLTKAQLITLTPAQIQFIRINTLGVYDIQDFTIEQISALTLPQIASLGSALVGYFTVAQISALTPAQISAFTPDQVTALLPELVAALSQPQVSALSSAQVEALSTTQKSNMIPASDQLASILANLPIAAVIKDNLVFKAGDSAIAIDKDCLVLTAGGTTVTIGAFGVAITWPDTLKLQESKNSKQYSTLHDMRIAAEQARAAIDRQVANDMSPDVMYRAATNAAYWASPEGLAEYANAIERGRTAEIARENAMTQRERYLAYGTVTYVTHLPQNSIPLEVIFSVDRGTEITQAMVDDFYVNNPEYHGKPDYPSN